MATGTLGSSARDYHTRQTVYLSALLTPANFPAANTSFKLGTVPAGAIIKSGYYGITTAFNASSVNAISLGTSAGGAQLLSAGAGLATVGATALTISAGASQVPTADTDIYITGAFTAAPPTSGAGGVVLEYFIP